MEFKPSSRNIVYGTATLLVVLALLLFAIRLYSLSERVLSDIDPANDNEVVLARAEDAVRSAELILGFLEGASVLVAVAIGAAAVYGFRQTQELRTEFDKKWDELEETRQDLEKQLVEMRGYKPQLDRLAQLNDSLDQTRKELNSTINDVAFLLQADQEFRLGNYTEAYEFSQRVLEHDPDNLLALYITGWMETHYQRSKLDMGIEKLEKATNQARHLNLKWPSARAAYGVALRRKGMSLRQTDLRFSNELLLRAEGELKATLGTSSELVDFNGESFWGTIGGIMRDLGRMEDAIKAYEEALRVTAGSSYPQGNLAALLLHRASHLENPEFREEIEEDALDAFQLTEQFAYAELAQRPSDFFLLMDIAMAATILSCRDAKYKFTARQFFERAMNKRASEELLNVNMRGWQFLLANCPKGSRWGEVRGELQASINDLNHALAQLKAE